VQTQRRAEKTARETAQQERELRSYSHLMQARPYRVARVWRTSSSRIPLQSQVVHRVEGMPSYACTVVYHAG